MTGVMGYNFQTNFAGVRKLVNNVQSIKYYVFLFFYFLFFNPKVDGGGESAPSTFSPVTPVILALSSPNLVIFPKTSFYALRKKFEVDRKSLRGSTEALEKNRFSYFRFFRENFQKIIKPTT